MVKLVVIGSCNIDITVECERWPKPGETLFSNGLTISPGGKGANQAVAAARLGAEVYMVGCIGDDVYGTLVQKTLADSHVNADYVTVLPGEHTGTAHITIADNDNTIIVVKAANNMVAPKHVDAAWDIIQSADLVLLQHEIPQDTNAYVIERCAAAGIPVMLNPAPVAPISEALLDKITYLTPNEHEAVILFANQSMADILLRYQDKVIMTLGSRGVAYASKGEEHIVPAYRVQPVDTTGAGDTFNGAFAVARASGKSMEDSIRFANAAAALSVQKMGAQGGMPYLAEVNALLKE